MKHSLESQREHDENEDIFIIPRVRFIVPTTAELFREWMFYSGDSLKTSGKPLGPDDPPCVPREMEELGIEGMNWLAELQSIPKRREAGHTTRLTFGLVFFVEDEVIEDDFPCLTVKITPLDTQRCEVSVFLLFPHFVPNVTSLLAQIANTWPSIDMYTATQHWAGGRIGTSPTNATSRERPGMSAVVSAESEQAVQDCTALNTYEEMQPHEIIKYLNGKARRGTGKWWDELFSWYTEFRNRGYHYTQGDVAKLCGYSLQHVKRKLGEWRSENDTL